MVVTQALVNVDLELCAQSTAFCIFVDSEMLQLHLLHVFLCLHFI